MKEKFPMIYEAIRKGHEQNANAVSVPAENDDIIGRKDILTVNLAMPPHGNAANDGQPLIELHSHYNYTENLFSLLLLWITQTVLFLVP